MPEPSNPYPITPPTTVPHSIAEAFAVRCGRLGGYIIVLQEWIDEYRRSPNDVLLDMIVSTANRALDLTKEPIR